MGNITLDTEIHFTYKHLNSNISMYSYKLCIKYFKQPLSPLRAERGIKF